jgi:flagellar assembly protein FliH
MNPAWPNMKSYKVITLAASVRDVRLAATSSPGECEQRLREAEQAGYDRGRRDGERALGEQLMQHRAELLELHQGVAESLRGLVPRIVREVEQTLIDLALEVAQKLVAGLPFRPQLVETVVREALSQAGDSAEILVLLHPDDLALLRKHQSPILDGLPEMGPLRFASSADVTRGGCIVQTRFGLLDARRETKLEQMRQSIAA